MSIAKHREGGLERNGASIASMPETIDSKFETPEDSFDKLPVEWNYDPSLYAPLAPAAIDPESAGASFLQLVGLKKRDNIVDLDAIATQESVFETPLAHHYLPNSKWENYQHFDPTFRWTYREERSVQRKTDFKIFFWVVIMFSALNMCRSDLPNATADNLLADLKLTQGDYNLGNTLFKVGFLCAELPSQIIGKKLGVDIWLPTQMVAFSVLTAAQYWMRSRSTFLAFRVLIALFQGGFIPDTVLYCSYFYTKHQLPLRLAIYWCSISLTTLVSGFLSVGLLKMRGIWGVPGWCHLFLWEGIISLLIAIVSYFLMTPGPSQTKRPWRPNGYFTDKEIKIIVNRVIRDDPSKASMHNRQPLTWKLLWKGFTDYDLWPLYIIGLTFGIASYPITAYFQISMRRLGFSTVMSNLLSIPNVALTVVLLISITWLSEKINSRSIVCSIQNWWFLPFFIALRVVPDMSAWGYFAVATLILGYPYVHAIQVAWTSRNSGSVKTRTISASLYNMFVQASGCIGSNLYQVSDSPRYTRGNSIILGIIAANLVIIYPSAYFYYRARNAAKQRKWEALTLEEQSDYLKNTTDEGCNRLDFRFAY